MKGGLTTKILVLVKQVSDTATKIRLNPGDAAIQTDGIKWVINSYDEFAIEECLRIREKFGGQVVVVSLGTARVEETIRQAQAMGADRARQPMPFWTARRPPARWHALARTKAMTSF